MAHLANSRQLARRIAGSVIAVIIVAGIAAGTLAILSPRAEAHKAITSKFNYNEHIFPILRDRCARCHYQGGPTPMSLTTYQDAVPWAESMREQLVGQKMPPWYSNPTGPSVKGGHLVSTRELDTLLTWATGGTPAGDLQAKLPTVSAPAPWKSGPPDHQVKMPEAHNVPAGTQEEDFTVSIPSGLTEEKWIKAIDIQPSDTSMVRDAVISLDGGQVLGAWVPGHDALASPNGTAFKLAPGAKLTLKIHYKKSWQDEQNAKTDQTAIGLYFTDAPLSGKSIESLDVKGPASPSASDVTFSGALKSGARVLALRPSFDQAYQEAVVDAVLPNGRRATLMKFRSPQPLWYRRYWLTEPIELPAGTKLEVKAVPAPVDEFAPPVAKRYPLQVAFDYVPQ